MIIRNIELRCPKCKSNNILAAYEQDDQSFCGKCEYQGYTEISIYGPGFIPEDSEIAEELREDSL